MTNRQQRGRGDGTISLRKDGRYEIRVKDPVTGKRRSSYARDLPAARRKLRQMLSRKESGGIVLDSSATVEAYAKIWLGSIAGRRRADSTVREYRRRFEKYINPSIGRVRLVNLSPLDVERMLDEVRANGLSKSTAQGTRNALSAMLSDAVKSRHASTNVASHARLPEYPPRTIQSHATAEEVGSLLDCAGDSDMGRLLTVLALTGCRIGEALGARWADLDLALGTWRLSRTTTLNSRGQVVVGNRTKTGEARLVALQPPVVAVLKAQKATVARLKLKAGAVWVDEDLVFPTTIGTPQDSRNLRKQLSDLKRASGYRHSFHELRHFFATVAASEVPMSSLSKVLGHRRLATTSDLYSHLYAPDASRASAAVGRALSRGSD